VQNVGKKDLRKTRKEKDKVDARGGRDSDGVVDDEGVAQQNFSCLYYTKLNCFEKCIKIFIFVTRL